MKNYQFVVGLLLSSVVSHGVHAASPSPAAHANRAAFPATGGSSILVQSIHAAPPADRQFAMPRPPTAAEVPLNNFLSFASLSNAFHYLEGGASAAQGLRAQTRLTQQTTVAKDVTEPASEILLLAGLSALAIAIRRQSPS
ncbi:MAG: hypothetical protein WKG03_04060 [Telluria sp.]